MALLDKEQAKCQSRPSPTGDLADRGMLLQIWQICESENERSIPRRAGRLLKRTKEFQTEDSNIPQNLLAAHTSGDGWRLIWH
jgi:hypothetical protein